MRSCAPCEATSWEYNGRPAGFDAVRDVMSETRRTFMRPNRVAA